MHLISQARRISESWTFSGLTRKGMSFALGTRLCQKMCHFSCWCSSEPFPTRTSMDFRGSNFTSTTSFSSFWNMSLDSWKLSYRASIWNGFCFRPWLVPTWASSWSRCMESISCRWLILMDTDKWCSLTSKIPMAMGTAHFTCIHPPTNSIIFTSLQIYIPG